MNARLVGMLVVLTLVAGYVDAVAFFSMGVFTANMTGNTVLLGGGIAASFIPAPPGSFGILLPLLSLGSFTVGAVCAAYGLRRETSRPPVRSRAMLVLVAIAIGLCFTIPELHLAPWAVHAPTIGLLSFAMGIQSVIATRAGVAGVSTTVVTGTMVRAIVDYFGTPLETIQVRREGAVNASVWGSYLAGALAGTLAEHALGIGALGLPGVVVLVLVLVV